MDSAEPGPALETSSSSPRPRGESVSESRTRIRMLVETAAENGSSISLGELHDLLASNLFPSSVDLGRFIIADDGLSEALSAIGDEVTLRGQEALAVRRVQQRALTAVRLDAAARFLARLGRICPWIELAGVSGSTAYDGAKPADDIDFFLVTRDRRLWISLLTALVYAKLERLRSDQVPIYCFNRMLEREACAAAFRERRDALFAREALNLRLLRGRRAYTRLLESAPWMSDAFPALYASRLGQPCSEDADGEAADPRGAWLLNGLALLVLGPYLWLAGLWRNSRLRREGRDRECFRTVIRPEFWATESVLFDELREQYARAFA